MIKLQFPILLLLVSFASVGAVLFTPALPIIVSFFQVSAGQAQSTVTFYILGYAFGQLPYGPLANRFGRKPALYIGVSIAILGSLLCALSSPLHSFGLLIAARILQALGASVGLKVSFTMVADVYDQLGATKMIARIVIAFAIMPGAAVAVGGWLTQYLGWESCFYFLALFGLTVLGLVTRLPETSKGLDPKALNVMTAIGNYAAAFKNSRLVTSGLMMGCGTAVSYIFASKAPFIGINLIGLSPSVFGNYNLIPLLGMLLGTLLTLQIAGRFSVFTILLTGVLASLIATMTMLLPFALGILTPFTLFIPMFLIYLAEALVFANISSFGLAGAKNKANGSAVLNFTNLSTAVIAVLFSEWIGPESALLMPISFIFFFTLMLFAWFRLKKLQQS